METYGITTSTITSILPIEINSRTKPSEDAVATIINMNASMVNNIAIAVGISSSTSTDPVYQILRNMVLYKTMSDILAAKNSGTEQAKYYENQYKEAKDLLMNYPQHVGQPTAPQRARVLTYGDSNTDLVDPVARKIIGGGRRLNTVISNC